LAALTWLIGDIKSVSAAGVSVIIASAFNGTVFISFHLSIELQICPSNKTFSTSNLPI
jgi:hypothetical protein